ncbi:MAG: rhomboid family intramembrane serine protease [Pseudomonadota bacterium]|nr:rhomboid family intramembrane serine protease [Pseudomonadota bacterium]
MEKEPPSVSPDAHGEVPVFRGSQAACLEFGLVLDAKGFAYDRVEAEGEWRLLVAPAEADLAGDELARYAAERPWRRSVSTPLAPHHGSVFGAAVYAFALILVAYCAGIELFGVDWLEAGALRSGLGPAEWWRPVTALTLHLDQEHLLGNLLFGAGVGVLAGRMFGPGAAWLGILLSGAAANTIDMLVSPAGHRAVGASTAVFAALGLLAGFGWGQRFLLRDRRLHRWAPLFGGVSLLVLLGAGNEHVDVLGHLLGFLVGTLLGWGFAKAGLPRRGAAFQTVSGSLAILLLCAAWLAALLHAR